MHCIWYPCRQYIISTLQVSEKCSRPTASDSCVGNQQRTSPRALRWTACMASANQQSTTMCAVIEGCVRHDPPVHKPFTVCICTPGDGLQLLPSTFLSPFRSVPACQKWSVCITQLSSRPSSLSPVYRWCLHLLCIVPLRVTYHRCLGRYVVSQISYSQASSSVCVILTLRRHRQYDRLPCTRNDTSRHYSEHNCSAECTSIGPRHPPGGQGAPHRDQQH